MISSSLQVGDGHVACNINLPGKSIENPNYKRTGPRTTSITNRMSIAISPPQRCCGCMAILTRCKDILRSYRLVVSDRFQVTAILRSNGGRMHIILISLAHVPKTRTLGMRQSKMRRLRDPIIQSWAAITSSMTASPVAQAPARTRTRYDRKRSRLSHAWRFLMMRRERRNARVVGHVH